METAMSKKPEGLDNFHSLLGALAQVPKRELDREIEKDAKRKARKKAPKRKK
jgi:hypothetical protein